jgi:hypothetical protein
MGKIGLTYDQLELRPALGNELSSSVKGPLYFLCACVTNKAFHRHDSLMRKCVYLALFVWTGDEVAVLFKRLFLLLLSAMLFNGINSI